MNILKWQISCQEGSISGANNTPTRPMEPSGTSGEKSSNEWYFTFQRAGWLVG